jgi:xylitol oxidase
VLVTSANWAGNYHYTARELLRPTSVAEVQEAVAAASRVKALGSRHSFNDIADTAGVQLSLDSLPPELTIDPDAGTVTVAAAARYGEIAERLHGAGFGLQNLASLPHISVGGAVATGTHGSGDRTGSLATAVAAIELVTADGGLVSIRRGDPDFDGVVVALGALGVVTRVTLDVEPTFEVRQHVYENLAWSTLYDNLDAVTSAAYSVSLFTDWSERGIGQVWLKSRVDAGPSAAGEPTFFGASLATRALHPLPGVSADSVSEQGGVPGPWWNRLPHFTLGFTPSNGEEIQTEYLIDRRDVIAATEAVRAIASRIAPHLYMGEIRTIGADRLWLSPSFGRDSIGLHFTWKRTDAVAGLLPLLDAALAPFAARPHWGKVFETDAARFDSLYPKIGEFRRLAERLDPGAKFSNSYRERTIFADRD